MRGLFVFSRGNPVTFDGVELPLMDAQQEVLIELGSEENSYLTFDSFYSKFWDVKYDPDFWIARNRPKPRERNAPKHCGRWNIL